MSPRVVVIRAAAKRVVVRGLTVGTRGPSGTAAGATEYAFSTPAATWTVHHNLGRTPIVQVIGDLNDLQLASVDHPDTNTAVVTHFAPTTGSVLVL